MGSLSRPRRERLERLIAYLEEYWVSNWTSPTVREVMTHMGWTSASTAHNFLRDARRDGFIETMHLSSRRVLYRPTSDVRSKLWNSPKSTETSSSSV